MNKPQIQDESQGDDGNLSIGACFELKAGQHADKLAVKSDCFSFSYSQLNSRANQIADLIRQKAGSSQQARVALLMEQDAPLIAAILGVLKSGNIYVPLDPAYPLQRTQYIVRDADAQLIFTDSENLALANQLTEYAAINLDELDDTLSTTEFQQNTSPDALAYILYTSGSTGQPKGVLQTHRNLLHHVRNYSRGLRITSGDRLTLFFSCCFSASLMDVFGALLNGATLFPYYLKNKSITALGDWLVANKISVFHSNPGVFRQFCRSLSSSDSLPDLRIFDVAGEPFYQTDMDLFREHFNSDCVLVNHLACTEASVVAQLQADKDTRIESKVVSVGFEAPGIKLSIVDENGKQVATGVIGEILIQSEYLSPGYWNKPELTGAVFTAATDGSSERVFHTADLGYITDSGCITHLGRKDSRVKIRGYSVELAEVEGALRKHPSVKDAAVVAHQHQQGHLSLVAYFAHKSDLVPSVRELRLHMKNEVAEFMVPAFFVHLESLPVTPNGKIDRKALPRLDHSRPHLDTEFITPSNPLEEQLQAIWERVLGVSPVGVKDQFSELGGDSLLAMALFLEMEKAFKVFLPSSALTDTGTIEGLSGLIGNCQAGNEWRLLVPIHPQGGRLPIFCIHEGGSWLHWYWVLAKLLNPEQPIYGLQPSGQDGKQKLHCKIKDYANCYVREIRKVQPEGPYRIMGYSFGALVAYEMAQQLRRKHQDVAHLILVDAPIYIRARQSLWKKMKRHLEAIKQMGVSQKLGYFYEQIFGVRPPGHPIPMSERDQFFMTIARKALLSYEHRPYLGKALLIRSTQFNLTTWKQYLRGPLDVRSLECGHRDLIRSPMIETIAEIINEVLAADEPGQA